MQHSILINSAFITFIVAIEQDHRGSRWFAVREPDSAAPEVEIPAESNKRREERDEKAHDYVREKKLRCNNGIWMCAN